MPYISTFNQLCIVCYVQCIDSHVHWTQTITKGEKINGQSKPGSLATFLGQCTLSVYVQSWYNDDKIKIEQVWLTSINFWSTSINPKSLQWWTPKWTISPCSFLCSTCESCISWNESNCFRAVSALLNLFSFIKLFCFEATSLQGVVSEAVFMYLATIDMCSMDSDMSGHQNWKWNWQLELLHNYIWAIIFQPTSTI